MTIADIIILIIVVLLLGTIIYFSIIRPKLRHEGGCTKCPYAKQCNISQMSGEKTAQPKGCCQTNKTPVEKSKN